jgi:hypothetical protein
VRDGDLAHDVEECVPEVPEKVFGSLVVGSSGWDSVVKRA